MNLIRNFKLKIDNFLLSPKAKDDVNRAINTINRFLNERENSKDYRDFVATVYKKRGYGVWEYSQEDRSLNLIFKRQKEIILATCRDDNKNISLEEEAFSYIKESKIMDFEIIKKEKL